MDPLSALREYTIRNDLDKILRISDDFHFAADYTFPATGETAYRSKQGNFYTLETLIFYIKNHHLKHTDYLQLARTNKIPSVTLPDRKPLLEYLTGKISSTDAIEFNPKFPGPATTDAIPALEVAGIEEYRPEDPNVMGFSSVSADEENGAGVRVSERSVDYMSMIRALERPLKDRETLLECRNRDFYTVLVQSTKREEMRQRMESQQRKDGLVAKSRLLGSDDRGIAGYGEDLGFDSNPKPKKMHKLGEGVPIILVPSAFQTLITIYNVKEFLEDGVFIPTDTKVKQMKGMPKPDCVTVQKKFSRDRVVAAYEVRDKPSTLKAEDWDRVVAVFVLGKEWQFKDWPFKDHVELFNKIIGFYMRFEDDSVESAKTVKQWNVKIISVSKLRFNDALLVACASVTAVIVIVLYLFLFFKCSFFHDMLYDLNTQISKNKRHQDRAAALEVWDRLEEFVRSRSHT